MFDKWEKVEDKKSSSINTHDTMKIVHIVHKVKSQLGTYEIRISSVKGMKLRELVPVKRKRDSVLAEAGNQAK
jgi:hypothetical protein